MTSVFSDPVREEIWQVLLRLNDCWTTPDGNPEQLYEFFHKNMVAITPSDRKRIEGQGACVAGWVAFARSAKIHRWEEQDPRIDIYGKSAVVTYYFDMSFTMGGHKIDMKGRDMFFFVKESGHWWAVANQFSPIPV